MTTMSVQTEKKIVSTAIVAGILLYLSKLLRPYFSENNSAMFALGILPNLGLAFAIPFIYVANRIRLNRPIKHFTAACLITFALMILNEARDQIQTGRVFDWYDIMASLVGVVFALIVFRFLFKVKGKKG